MAMRPIPFATQSYAPAEPSLSAERMVNCYLEQQPDTAVSKFAVRHTPGLVEFSNIGGGGPLYAMEVQRTEIYAVAGNVAIRVNADGGWFGLGDITTGADLYRSTIACSGSQIVFCCPPYLFYSDGVNFQPIAIEGLPGIGSVACLNGYFIYSELNGSRFWVSKLQEAQTVDILDFAAQERSPNVIMGVKAFNQELWVYGRTTVEVWSASGAAFPFSKQQGAVIELGTASFRSVAFVDNALYWLGNDLVVYRTNGYKPERVSTWPIDALFAAVTGVPSAIGMALSHAGHAQYCLTVPDAGVTRVFDIASKLWHERSSGFPDARWRGQCSVRYGDFQVVGDGFEPKIWRLDRRSSTEGGIVPRTLVFPTLYAETGRAFMSRFELLMDAGGTEPFNITLDYSDDGGRTYINPRMLNSGGLADFAHRLFATRLGSFRSRIIRLRITTAQPVALYNAYADIEGGAS